MALVAAKGDVPQGQITLLLRRFAGFRVGTDLVEDGVRRDLILDRKPPPFAVPLVDRLAVFQGVVQGFSRELRRAARGQQGDHPLSDEAPQMPVDQVVGPHQQGNGQQRRKQRRQRLLLGAATQRWSGAPDRSIERSRL